MAKFRNQASTRTTVSRIGGSAIILSIILLGIFATQEDVSTQEKAAEFTAPSSQTVQEINTQKNVSQELTQAERSLEQNSSFESLESSSTTNTTESSTARKSNSSSTKSVAAPMKASSAAKFSSMNSSIEGNAGKLVFKTSYQRHIKTFEIQRSLDDDTYETIGRIDGEGSGEHTQEKLYEFLDKTLAMVQMPRVYYRVKQIGYDGLSDYSDPIEHEFGLDLGLYARIDQSAKGKIKLLYAADREGPISMRILNVAGEIIQKKNVDAGFDPQYAVIDASTWKAGKYFLQLQDETTSVMEQFYYEK